MENPLVRCLATHPLLDRRHAFVTAHITKANNDYALGQTDDSKQVAVWYASMYCVGFDVSICDGGVTLVPENRPSVRIGDKLVIVMDAHADGTPDLRATAVRLWMLADKASSDLACYGDHAELVRILNRDDDIIWIGVPGNIPKELREYKREQRLGGVWTLASVPVRTAAGSKMFSLANAFSGLVPDDA